jgi:hypothetical protein
VALLILYKINNSWEGSRREVLNCGREGGCEGAVTSLDSSGLLHSMLFFLYYSATVKKGEVLLRCSDTMGLKDKFATGDFGGGVGDREAILGSNWVAQAFPVWMC